MAKKASSKKTIKAKTAVEKKIETAEKKALKTKAAKAVKLVRKKLGKGLEDISTLFLSDIKKDSAVNKKSVKPSVGKTSGAKVAKIKAAVVKKAIKNSTVKSKETAVAKSSKKTIVKADKKTAAAKKAVSKKIIPKAAEKTAVHKKAVSKKTKANADKKTAIAKKAVFKKIIANVAKKTIATIAAKTAVVKANVPEKTVAKIVKKTTVGKESGPKKIITQAVQKIELNKDINSNKTTVLIDKKTAKKIIEKKPKKIAEKKLKAKQATSKPIMKKTEVVSMGTLKKSSKEDKKPAKVKTTAKKTVKLKTVKSGNRKVQDLGPISALKTISKKIKKSKLTADLQNIQREQVIEDSKFFVSKETVNRIKEDEFFELPEGYGDNRIIIQVRDPYWLFSYWEVSRRKLHSVVEKYGNCVNNARRVLRVYDITSVSFNGNNAKSFFDIEINDAAKNWYVNVGNPGRSYCIDIGLILEDGRFVVLARSNFVTTPIDGPSMITDEEWMIVEDDFNKLYGLSAGLGIGLSSGELRKQIRTRLKNLSSGILTSPGVTTITPNRNFWMVVNTELIVYGATQPGSELTVQGKPIVLNEDGTFSLRFALPDGEQVIPVRAISPDKVEERVITPVVTKNTV